MILIKSMPQQHKEGQQPCLIIEENDEEDSEESSSIFGSGSDASPYRGSRMSFNSGPLRASSRSNKAAVDSTPKRM